MAQGLKMFNLCQLLQSFSVKLKLSIILHVLKTMRMTENDIERAKVVFSTNLPPISDFKFF